MQLSNDDFDTSGSRYGSSGDILDETPEFGKPLVDEHSLHFLKLVSGTNV